MTNSRSNSSKRSKPTSKSIADVVSEVGGALGISAEAKEAESVWKTEPLGWKDFFSSKDHMAFPRLSEKQIEFCTALLPDDPKKTFDRESRKKTIGVLLSGKGCIAGEEEVLLGDGSIHTVKDLSRGNRPVPYITMGADGRQATLLGTPFYCKGETELFEVQTSYGKRCRVTDQHQFFTPDGWKKLEELKIGDWVASPATLDLPETENISDDEAFLIGAFIGDGYLKNVAIISVKDQQLARALMQSASVIGCKTTYKHQIFQGNWKSSNLSLIATKRSEGNPARALLIKYRLLGRKTAQKRIPQEFFRCNKSARIELIRGLFSTDGWLCRKSCPGKPKKEAWELGYCAKSYDLARDVQLMLLSINVVTHIHEKRVLYRGEYRIYYQIVTSEKQSIYEFCVKIKNLPVSGKDVSAALYWSGNKVKQGSGRMCPHSIFNRMLKQKDRLSNRHKRQINKQRGMGGARQQTLYKWALESQLDEFLALTHPDILWEKISSVKSTGVGKFYSPSVPLTHNYFAAGLYHHNSGKDQISVMLACYIVQILLNLRKPFEFAYGVDVPGEPIDIVIVAPRGRTSEKVTFEKLRQRVLHWGWLKEKYKILQSGGELNPTDRTENSDSVTILGNTVVFPGNIRVFALNSSLESAEGYNLLVFIGTEVAGFLNSDDKPNADKIYNVLYTSANTRFPGRFLGVWISYPRYKGDAIMSKYEEALTSPHMFGMKASSWEFNPMLKREDYEAELNNEDPAIQADARAKYLCEPGDKESRFIELPDRIKACISGRKQMAEVEGFEDEVNGMKMARMKIIKYNLHPQPSSVQYVARVDLGKAHDRTALCVAHLENGRVIVDLLVHWIPDSRRKLVVDVDDAANLILELKKRYNIIFVSYDQWNSASSINRLNRKGIITELLSLGGKEYKLFLHSLYSRAVDLIDFPAFTDEKKGELFHLTLDAETGKVDHEEGWHNDLTEAVCGVVAMLLGLKKNLDSLDSGLGNISPNLQYVGDEIWSQESEITKDLEDGEDIFPGEGMSVHLP